MKQCKYKLYAVGTTNPDPNKWSVWDEIALVIASSEEEAMEIGRDSTCIEVPLDRPRFLMKECEPSWGEDL